MTDNEIIKAFDILDKFEFFAGQRAGRELWFNKPADIQNKDIGGFLRDLDFLKQFINRQKTEIERLQTVKKHIHNSILIDCDYSTAEAYNSAFQKALKQLYDNADAKSEAINDFAERLKRKKWSAVPEYVFVYDIDNLVKEIVGEQE